MIASRSVDNRRSQIYISACTFSCINATATQASDNTLGPHVLVPCRYLVKEGDLLKLCNGGPRRYKFVLFNDTLVYGTETTRVKLLMDSKHRKYKQHQRIPLRECLVKDYDDDIAFVIARPGGKSFVVSTNSAQEKQARQWLKGGGGGRPGGRVCNISKRFPITIIKFT